MLQILAWRAWVALIVFCAIAMVFGMLGARAYDYEQHRHSVITQPTP